MKLTFTMRIVLSLVVAISGCTGSSKISYASLTELEIRNTIQKGMTEAEVVTVVGEPHEKDPSIWFYYNRAPFMEKDEQPKHFSVRFVNGRVDSMLVSHGK